MTELTEQRIAEITARHEAATPGPLGQGINIAKERFVIYSQTTQTGIAEVLTDTDCSFFAHARQDIPDILAALADKDADIKRLNAEVARRDEEFKKERQELQYAAQLIAEGSPIYVVRKREATP